VLKRIRIATEQNKEHPYHIFHQTSQLDHFPFVVRMKQEFFYTISLHLMESYLQESMERLSCIDERY